MGDPPSGAPLPQIAPEDRLDSWKEIAAYLKRDVTTVQRWEKREGMPVRRHVHDKLGSVYAFRSELDGWARSRNLSFTGDGADANPPPDRSTAIDAVLENAEQPTSNTLRARRPLRLAWGLAAVGVLVLSAAIFWLRERTEYFWRSPIAEAQFQHLTDFDGTEQAAAISRDGRLVAFQSDRDGRMDVWVTQVGTGRFYNLTRGRVQEIVNSSVRTIGFSPDGALVTFWARRTDGSGAGTIGVWAVPALGGEPQPYLEGVGEFDWSSDGSRLVYHMTGPGDPTFVRNPGQGSEDQPIFTAAPGLHAHFPFWSRDQAFVYFVQGEVLDAMDIWRIRPSGGAAERITYHNSRVTYPVMLNYRTLMYLATGADGFGQWLYTLDVERRVPHRVSSGVDSYTSLAVSADGRRLVMTLASPKGDAVAHVLGRQTRRCVSRHAHLADNGTWILPAARAGLSALRLVERHERQYLEARRRQGDRALDGAGRAHRRKPRDRPGWTSHRILGRAARQNAVVRDECRRHGRPRRDRIA